MGYSAQQTSAAIPEVVESAVVASSIASVPGGMIAVPSKSLCIENAAVDEVAQFDPITFHKTGVPDAVHAL